MIIMKVKIKATSDLVQKPSKDKFMHLWLKKWVNQCNYYYCTHTTTDDHDDDDEKRHHHAPSIAVRRYI